MTVNSSLLVSQVRERPCLWDRADPDYFNKALVADVWDEIARVQRVHTEMVKVKWKGLRDTYRYELKKKKKNVWRHFHNMAFLKGHMKSVVSHKRRKMDVGEEEGEETTIEYENTEENSAVDPIATFTSDIEEESTMELKTAKTEPVDAEEEDEEIYPPDLLNILPEVGKLEEKDRSVQRNADIEDDNDDYHFLMSLLPQMKQMDVQKKMRLRLRMMELFYKEMYED